MLCDLLATDRALFALAGTDVAENVVVARQNFNATIPLLANDAFHSCMLVHYLETVQNRQFKISVLLKGR